MNRIASSALCLAAIAVGVTSCSQDVQSTGPTTTPSSMSSSIAIPDAVRVPPGNKLISTLHGSGQQIYQCTDTTWTLLQPAAVISDGSGPVAVHSKGPVWISTVDGSEVTAAPVPGAKVNHDTAIPDLLLKASETHGTGLFGSVTYVQRLATEGGLAPKGPCDNGARVSAAYSATYLFYTGSA